MKQLMVIISLTFIICHAGAQVKIGGTPAAPAASAVLELDGGNNRGLLLPRMRKLDIDAIQNPAEGLTIYATDEQAVYLRKSLVWEKQAPFSLPYQKSISDSYFLLNISNLDEGNGVSGAIRGYSKQSAGLMGETDSGFAVRGIASEGGIGGYFSCYNGGAALVVPFGRTGLGITKPTGMLHVNANTNNGLAVIIDDDAASTIQMQNAGIDKGYIQTDVNDMVLATNLANNTGKVILRTNGADRLIVDNSGNTGIGAPSIGARLYVDATAFNATALIVNDQNPIIQLQNSGVNKGYIQADVNDMVLATNFSNNTGKVILRTNNFDRLLVNTDGKIIIGSPTGTSPAGSQMVKVKGGIQATDFTVTALAAWPDYVFAEGYKLKSLEETEAFIKANKHLPNIPAAAVVEKDGFALGDMQKRMMEKIEELTLHLIESNKKIIQLEQVVSAMQIKK